MPADLTGIPRSDCLRLYWYLCYIRIYDTLFCEYENAYITYVYIGARVRAHVCTCKGSDTYRQGGPKAPPTIFEILKTYPSIISAPIIFSHFLYLLPKVNT